MLTAIDKQEIKKALVKYEGNVPYMYLDSKGYVTVGIGHMMKTVQDAQKVPFQAADKKKATAEQIKADFESVKKQPKNQHHSKYKNFTKLTLENSVILKQVNSHIDTYYKELARSYPGFGTFPKEVKYAMFDMAFNLGVPKLKTGFPNFNTAITNKDWTTAAKESHRKAPISELRNNYVKKLFEKAAKQSTAKTNTKIQARTGGGASGAW